MALGIPNAHEIVPGLWLGNAKAAGDSKWLAQKNITVVFNATKDLPFSPTIKKQYRIPVHDNLQPDEIRNMTLWSQEAVYRILEEHIKNRQIVLVHCAAGMQRSAALVAMYLIATKRMDPQQSITFIQGIRPIAFRPSANFKASIIEFDKTYHREILPRLQSS